jgi:hypothetical protein
MSVVATSLGTFTLNIYPRITLPEADDEEGAAVQFGADFDVSFVPKSTHNIKLGLIQLIRPLTDVGPYRQNKTASGWAIDKNRNATANASNYAYKLMFGITDDNVRPQLPSRFGINGAPTISRDTPKELLLVESEKIGRQHTKFVHYVAILRSNTIHDEGVIWSYLPTCAGGSGATEISDPRRMTLFRQ